MANQDQLLHSCLYQQTKLNISIHYLLGNLLNVANSLLREKYTYSLQIACLVQSNQYNDYQKFYRICRQVHNVAVP
jgi:hypothetical protein